MFLDELPVSYVFYTEQGAVKTIIGLEVADQHWDQLKDPQQHFGMLPIFIGAHDTFDELMEVLPKDDIIERVKTLVPALSEYVKDPSDNNLKVLLTTYKELSNEEYTA